MQEVRKVSIWLWIFRCHVVGPLQIFYAVGTGSELIHIVSWITMDGTDHRVS